MKTLLMMILALLLSCSIVTANDWRDLNTKIEKSGMDDVLHVGSGALIAWVVEEKSSLEGWKKHSLAIGLPIAVGITKELTDKNFDWGDVAGWAAGSIFMVTIKF